MRSNFVILTYSNNKKQRKQNFREEKREENFHLAKIQDITSLFERKLWEIHPLFLIWSLQCFWCEFRWIAECWFIEELLFGLLRVLVSGCYQWTPHSSFDPLATCQKWFHEIEEDISMFAGSLMCRNRLHLHSKFISFLVPNFEKIHNLLASTIFSIHCCKFNNGDSIRKHATMVKLLLSVFC